MQEINFKKHITSDAGAMVIFLCFWISLLGFTKTTISGIHFQDDHQIITIQKELSSHNLYEVISVYVKKDLNIRLRPFYFVHRILITKVLGKDIFYWSLYTGLLAILTSFFLYKSVRLLHFSFFESLIFSFLSLLGPHTCIWWRLGPAETIGTFMLSLSLFFLSKSIISKYSKIYKVFAVGTIILSLLSKECFILLIPAVILLYLFFSSRIKKESYQTILKKNYIFIFILCLLFIIPLIYIFKYVGDNKIGYAGLSNNYFSIEFIKWTIVQLYKNIYFVIIIFGFFLLMQKDSIKSFKDLARTLVKTLLEHWFIIIIFFAVFLPQCLLYFRSGIETRYFVPFVLGFSILIIYLLNYISSVSGVTFFSKYAYFSLIIFVVIYLNFRVVVPSAIEFSDEGLQTKTFINNILNHSEKTDKLLFVLDPGSEYEWGFFLKEYFETELKRANFQFLLVSSNYLYPPHYASKQLFIQKFNKYLAKADELEKDKISCIAVLPLSFNLFATGYSDLIKSSKYSLINNSSFNVYYFSK